MPANRRPGVIVLCASIVLLTISCTRVGENDASVKAWRGVCDRIAHLINERFDAQTTTCIPANYSEGRPANLILVSDRPVLSNPASRKAWLSAVVGGVGLTMNGQLTMQCKEVVLLDSGVVKTREGLSLSCPTVTALQRDMKADKVGFDEAWAKIEEALKPVEAKVPQ